MRKKYLLILFLILSKNLFSQLSVNTTLTPTQLIQNVFLGTGISISNVTYSGSSGTIGHFSTGANQTNLGMSEGIVIASGLVDGSNGQNPIGSAATNFNSWTVGTGSDPDLANMVPGYTINDAAVLEFDFIPATNFISFSYVFASEEYPEWVGTSFNDAFGFFISGPDPVGGGNYSHHNIANIPGTSTPVSINNVNTITYPQYYVDNASGLTIVYDGMTVVLTATVAVIPCVSYHIKIAIGDAGDSAYDSAIFLQAHSLNVKPAKTSASIDDFNIFYSNDTTICTDTVTIDAGVGFDQYQWSTGDTTHFINITSSGNYYVSATATGCGTIVDSIHVSLTQHYMNLFVCNDTILCSIDTIQLNAGEGFSSYLWNNGSIADSIIVFQTGTYSIITQDTANCFYHDTIKVVMIPASSLNIGNDTAFCGYSTYTLTASSIYDSFHWSTGETTESIEVDSTGIYFVSATNNQCHQTARDTISIFFFPFPVSDAGHDTLICNGSSVVLQGSGGMYYNWFPSVGISNTSIPNPIASPVIPTTYHVTATNTYFYLLSDSIRCASLPDSVFVNVTPLPAPAQLCIATVDTAINKNVLIWEKQLIPGVDSIEIFRRTSGSLWTPIAMVSVNDTNYLVDNSSDPSNECSWYLALNKDTCDNTFGIDNAYRHTTMWLRAYPYFNYYSLVWTNYFGNGYDTHKDIIYRGTAPNNLAPIDSITNGSDTYDDYNINFGTTYYYMIKALRDDTCYSGYPYNNYTSSLSNIVTAIGAGITKSEMADQIFISPNPAHELISLNTNQPFIQNCNIYIDDVCGRQLLQFPVSKAKTDIDISSLAKGIYFLKVENKNGVAVKKFVKE
jgi:hypothetical protein